MPESHQDDRLAGTTEVGTMSKSKILSEVKVVTRENDQTRRKCQIHKRKEGWKIHAQTTKPYGDAQARTIRDSTTRHQNGVSKVVKNAKSEMGKFVKEKARKSQAIMQRRQRQN